VFLGILCARLLHKSFLQQMALSFNVGSGSGVTPFVSLAVYTPALGRYPMICITLWE
jgi:hypothetical protein